MSTLPSSARLKDARRALYGDNWFQRLYNHFLRPVLFRRYHAALVKNVDALELRVRQEFMIEVLERGSETTGRE
jgi:hypothetical protein